MVRPLTKRKKTGELYTRPAPVERNIEGALDQDLPALRGRLQVVDRESPDYLTSECLVHLFREASRRSDEAMRDAMASALFVQCKAILDFKVRASCRNAEDLREDILQEFALLLADDATGKNPDELDYFECRFNQAFAAFRIDLVRSELKEQSRFTSLPDDSPDPDDEVRSKIDQEPAERAEQGDGLARDELLSKLPPEVRKAVVLCHEMGYEVESKDPTKVTAATICGVTGRTIRNRLQEAAEYLSRYNQEDI